MNDNVVRPQFGARKPQSAQAAGEPGLEDMFDETPDLSRLTDEQLKRARADLLFMVLNAEFARAMRDKLQQAGDTIFSLGGFVVDKESIRLRREGLSALTLQELCEAIATTNELQWRSQPSYIGALTLEHHARVQLAMAVMPKTSE